MERFLKVVNAVALVGILVVLILIYTRMPRPQPVSIWGQMPQAQIAYAKNEQRDAATFEKVPTYGEWFEAANPEGFRSYVKNAANPRVAELSLRTPLVCVWNK